MDARTTPKGLTANTSPVLVGRDDLLALAERRLAAARAGAGHVLLLSGEAGIGKSRLLVAIERQAVAIGFTVVRASAFQRDLELTGALFDDLSRSLAQLPVPGYAAAAAAIMERLNSAERPPGDAHRLRRLLVHGLAESLAGLDRSGPVMFSLEDLHWADDVTLEVLFHVARMVRAGPTLLAATYRSDELYPRAPMRDWRARLLGQRLAEELRLEPLDLEETATVASAMLGGDLPASRDLVEALRAQSDGVPLYIEELLGAMATAGRLTGSGESGMPLPDTLSVAILQRIQSLSRTALRVATAAAVMGRSFDLEVLAASVGLPMERLAAPLGELQAHFVIMPTADGRGYDFRHALIRDAIYRDTPLPARRLLHGQVADATRTASARPSDADLSAHYEQAGRRAEAHIHALRAAERARALSAHREALELYRRALANLARDATEADRAAVLAAIGDEAAAMDQNEAAAEAYERARWLLLAEGLTEAAAAIVPRLAAVRHLLGDDLATRVSLIESCLAELESGGGGPDRAQAALRASLAAAYMLDRRLDESIAEADVARRLAALSSDLVTEVNATSTLASVLVLAGRMDEGWELHAATIDRARGAHLEAEAARAYRMLGTTASVLVEYALAERWLREGIEYAERVELWNHRHYMAGHLAHVAWATGDWQSAEEIAVHVLADGRGGITTRITALHVLGYVALGRGRRAAAASALDETRELGERMGELQRFAPAWWGLAEMALLSGDAARAVELTKQGFLASSKVRDAAYLFPFMITGTRARLAAGDPLAAERWVERLTVELRHRSIPGTLPAIDHARGLLALAAGSTGEARTALQAAATAWTARRRIWEGTWASIDLARCAIRAHRPAEAARLALVVQEMAAGLGSEPLAEAARAVLAGVRGRNVQEEPWAPLTAREFQVARLVAEGLTNPAIGVELDIANKTVAAHVEHILAKLNASRRAEIGAWAATVRPGEGVRD